MGKYVGKYALKSSEVRLLRNSLMTWVWVCPLCGYKGVYETHRRGLQAAKYHLIRKHRLEVEVVEE